VTPGARPMLRLERKDKDSHMTADRIGAIVVGGGLAGTTAARDLAHAGVRTVLVEARDRLGGRTSTQTIAGREVDTGGVYFHWFQSAIWREVTRYELPVVESALLTAARYLVGDADGVAAISPEEFDERQRRALSAFWGDPGYPAALPRPFAPQTDPRLAKLDAMSIEDRFRELGLDAEDERVLRAAFSDYGRPDDTSLGWLLQRMSNAIWSNEAYNALFAVYRLRDGMASLLEAMRHDGGFEVRLSSPVTAIERDDRGATVTLRDGSQLTAPVVVVATPVNVWRSIEFTPALDGPHAAATREGVTIPDVSSMVLHVRGVSEPVVMLSSFGDQPFEIMVTYTLLDDGQLLQAFSVSGRVTCADGHDRIAEALREVLPEAELVDVVGHDWPTDPFALGGWGSLRPGQLTRFIDVLDRPVGPLYFAGADIAPQFSGLLTGAIESGARAARRARLGLTGRTPDGAGGPR